MAWSGLRRSTPRRVVRDRCALQVVVTRNSLAIVGVGVRLTAGTAVDVGGGNEFGGAEDDEGCDDAAETKLDQFWQFGDIEVSRPFHLLFLLFLRFPSLLRSSPLAFLY